MPGAPADLIVYATGYGSRHNSQFLSLQLKARMEGMPTPVYKLAPSYHRR